MPKTDRQREAFDDAFNAANDVISECDWKTAVSVLMSLLASVVTLGPNATLEDADALVDTLTAQMKRGIRARWPQRERLIKQRAH